MAEAIHGPLHGQTVHHTCAVPRCLAPPHLQPVSQRDNTAEMLLRRYYVARIAALEAVVRVLDPSHEVLTSA
jgi:hypothetical protein